MPNLFDLPFEDEPLDEASASPVEPTTRRGPAAPAAPAFPDRVSTGPPATASRSSASTSAGVSRSTRVVYSVSELTAAIRSRLESEFVEVWVEGEVSNARLWNGLAYFTLKDGDAQLRVFMSRPAVRRLRGTIEDGLHVVVRGRLSVYEARGDYQLVCEHVEPKGLGALQLAFEQLKKKLAAEGLFDASRKRPLPVLPRRIGIVTSMDGAALRDMLRVIAHRHANVHIVIRAVRVQGEGAADDIARGVSAVARVPGVDVIIVGRGGGSIEDLWAFNEEPVARALAASPVPVISAVGHEIDWTIADFVADVRAATPSNAAELVIARKDEFCAHIERAAERLRAAAHRALETRRGVVHGLTARRGLAAVPLRVASRARHVDDLRACFTRALQQRLADERRALVAIRRRLDANDPVRRLGDLRARWLRADGRLGTAMARRRDRCAQELGTLAARLNSLSPLAVLGRGYALCWSADERTLLTEALPELHGERVSVTLAHGKLLCRVEDTSRPAERTGPMSEGER